MVLVFSSPSDIQLIYAQQDALRSRDIPESGRHDQEAGIIRRSKPLEDHEEISHDSRLLGEHASFPKTREHKRREGDATSMIQPLQSQDLRPQTVIIRKGLLGVC